MRLLILSFSIALAACAPKAPQVPSEALLGDASLPRTTIDGVKASLNRTANPNFVALDVAGSQADRKKHEAMGLRVAEELSGCKAARHTGSILDYIVEGAKPVRIAVTLTC